MVLSKAGRDEELQGDFYLRMVLNLRPGWVAGWHEVESAERVGRDQGHTTLTRPQIMMLMIHHDDADYYDYEYHKDDDDNSS